MLNAVLIKTVLIIEVKYIYNETLGRKKQKNKKNKKINKMKIKK